MLKEIELSDKFLKEYYKQINLNGTFKLSEMRECPVKFAKFMLGFTPRNYQSYLMKHIGEEQKLAVVKGRQIGFTTAIALYCLWYAWFKKAKTGATQNTKICVISKDDDAAKDLLQLIKDFMYLGDKHMSAFLKGNKMHTTTLFSREIVKNNVDELKLKNGSRIFSFPPTGKVRGKPNDILFIDEFDFLNNNDVDKFYYTDALPTISETGGKIIISSTPNGYGGLFYDLIDPDDKKEKHEFYRLMFPYTVLKSSKTYVDNVAIMKEHMDDSKFKQEYMCDFTQADISFFESLKVQSIFDNSVLDLDLNKLEYIAGIDYGMTESRTVITLCTKVEGIVYRVYYKEFESGWDINGVIPFMIGLKDRFKINKIVVDYCPQGDAINKKMIEMGWNVYEFDFHTKKIEAYCAFRQWMKVKYYN